VLESHIHPKSYYACCLFVVQIAKLCVSESGRDVQLISEYKNKKVAAIYTKKSRPRTTVLSILTIWLSAQIGIECPYPIRCVKDSPQKVDLPSEYAIEMPLKLFVSRRLPC
jgi:hypothetical protein